MKRFDLNGAWEFRARDAYKTLPPMQRSVTSWMPATVPGTVHTDLLANDKIPDPFYRMNENDVQWIDTQQWVYRRDFNLPASFVEESSIDLVADGLDTISRIVCNGKEVGETKNMFIGHRIGIRRFLRAGRNRLEVIFDSPVVTSKDLERRHGVLNVALEPHRVYIRKAQYSFSWDWGPKLTTTGIWRNIALEAYSSGRLRDPWVKVLSLSRDEAVLQVSVEIDRVSRRSLSMRAFIAGAEAYAEHTMPVRSNRVEFTVHVHQPQIWWPNGYGAQPMYKAVLTLMENGAELHTLEVPFAIRTVRLVQQHDADGRSFIFEINGVKIFCKGADWIPSDNFVPRIPDSTYETLLEAARDASMNMIRVWGGGVYEQDIFYNLCDRLGLMVWQDFMYACGEYPEYPAFLNGARQEAEAVVKRLRNHPSIVVWCGNNECEWLFCTEHPDLKPDDMSGAPIFRDVLANTCRELDGTRPYWRSSPFGAGFPNAESNGNHHQWIVWSFWKDYKEYEKDTARFVTEFGFQAPANRKTFEEVTLPEDRWPQSVVMEHHNKQIEGTERLLRFQASHYAVGTEFDDFLYKGQLVQAEALKFAAEHWRRRKFRTAGMLFWQLNDCWPVSSWSVIDSALRPKAAYYYARRFYAPVLVSCKKEEGGISVWLTNDKLEKCTGEVTVTLRSFTGRVRAKQHKATGVTANSAEEILRLRDSFWKDVDAARHYIHVLFQDADGATVVNRYFFNEPKHLQLPKGRVKATVKTDPAGDTVVVLETKAFAKSVRLEAEGGRTVFEDNYFDMDAGERRTVRVLSPASVGRLRKGLRIKTL